MLIGSVVEFLLISVLIIWRHFDPYKSLSCGLTLSEHARVLEGRLGDASASIPGGIGRRYAQFDCISVWNFTPYPRSGWLDWFSARALRGSTSTDLPSKIDTVAQKLWRGENSMLVEPRPTACASSEIKGVGCLSQKVRQHASKDPLSTDAKQWHSCRGSLWMVIHCC